MSAPVVFVDTETTGLDPDAHEIWEVGLIEADGVEHHWFLPVDLGRADPYALKIGRYYERHPTVVGFDERDGYGYVDDLDDFADEFAELTAGKHLVGAVISFDAERLTKLLRTNGACPDWHYHLIDVEALAVGYLQAKEGDWSPPWKSDQLTAALGIEIDGATKHTAIGDARWAKAIYDAVMAPSGTAS